MINTLITSKTRVKLLQKFFLNPNTVSYLRNLESELGESTNSIRIELNRFEDAGMLCSFSEGNKKYYRANKDHPIFNELQSIVFKEKGLDKLVLSAKLELNHLDEIILTGDLASGRDSDLIDLIFVGQLERRDLSNWVEATELKLDRRIRYLNYTSDELNNRKMEGEYLILWKE